MIRLVYMTDYMEQFAFNLLKGILAYSNSTETWAVSKMPTSFKQSHGIQGVLDWALQWRADAIIGQFDPEDDIDIFRRNGIIVVAQDYKQLIDGVINITGNYVLTGELAAEFFISKGYVNFAFYGYKDVIWSDRRAFGFCNYLKDNGLAKNYFSYQKDLIDNPWIYDTDDLCAWLKTLPENTAIFCCDDTSAGRLIEACHIVGIDVPRSIAVLGVDNDYTMTQLSVPNISSIDIDVAGAGYEAARLIDDIVKKRTDAVRNIVINPRFLVERASSDYYPVMDAHIKKVLVFIDEHLSEPLPIDRLLEQVPMSRRLLELKFKRTTNMTMKRYIFLRRINKLCSMLLLRSDSINVLSEEAGLGDTKNLSRVFSSVVGCTPTEYRMRNR